MINLDIRNMRPVHLTCTHHVAKYGQLNEKHNDILNYFEIFLKSVRKLIHKTQKPFFFKEGNGKLILYNGRL